MGKYTIVAADNIKGSGLDLLKKHFGADSVVVRGKFDEDELVAKIKDGQWRGPGMRSLISLSSPSPHG